MNSPSSLTTRPLTLSPDQFDVYLASASPRRAELLEQIGVSFRRLSVDVPEVPRRNEPAEVFVQRLALDKARAGWEQLESDDTHPVLGADTAVVIDGDILGKPRDEAHARAMLERLSGRSHRVLSAVALMTATQKAVKVSVSTVTFRPIAPEEMAAYWATGEPADKAGGYAIQGRAAVFVERLEGSYSGVMGLPLYETAELLGRFGISLW